MDREPKRESAEIYPFPAGGRAPMREKPSARTDKVVTSPGCRGWYHDAAIRQAQHNRDGKSEPEPRG